MSPLGKFLLERCTFAPSFGDMWWPFEDIMNSLTLAQWAYFDRLRHMSKGRQ
jgi:hypothetical protein